MICKHSNGPSTLFSKPRGGVIEVIVIYCNKKKKAILDLHSLCQCIPSLLHHSLKYHTSPWIVEMVGRCVPWVSGARNPGVQCPQPTRRSQHSTAHTPNDLTSPTKPGHRTHGANQARAYAVCVCEIKSVTYRLGPAVSSDWASDERLTTSACVLSNLIGYLSTFFKKKKNLSLQNRGYLSTWASTFAAKGRAFAPYICRVSQTHVNPVRTYFYILLGISLRENKCCASSNGGDFRENKRRRVKKGRWMEVGLKLCNIYLQWIFYGILSIFGTISQAAYIC
jgi:hypothetical protein